MKFLAFLTLATLIAGFEPPSKKLILITGSDWCQNCHYLEKSVLSDSNFLKFTAENHILVEIADFPQRIPMHDSLRTKAAKTADFCRFNGEFPGIYLLDLKDSSLKKIEYNRENTSEFSSLLLP